EVPWLRGFEMRCNMVVPMRARDEVVGVITFGSRSGRRYRKDDLQVAEDLARRAALAIDNARLYQEAHDAMSRREQMLAIVSHDLKNPLTTIGASATLLARQADERSQRNIEAIQRASLRMQRLIADLLDVASIDAGRLTLETRAETIGALVDEVLESH